MHRTSACRPTSLLDRRTVGFASARPQAIWRPTRPRCHRSVVNVASRLASDLARLSRFPLTSAERMMSLGTLQSEVVTQRSGSGPLGRPSAQGRAVSDRTIADRTPAATGRGTSSSARRGASRNGCSGPSQAQLASHASSTARRAVALQGDRRGRPPGASATCGESANRARNTGGGRKGRRPG
jgi:hypothetical protein